MNLVKFSLGCPVKASKFYQPRHGYTEHQQEENLYAIGEEASGNEVKHTKDVKSAYCTSATATFIYGADWPKMEKLLNQHTPFSGDNADRIYLYKGERKKALYLNPQKTLDDLTPVVERLEDHDLTTSYLDEDPLDFFQVQLDNQVKQ